MSFSEKEIRYTKELEKANKKNEFNELVIKQLKKELEKYAFKLFQLNEQKALEETMSATQNNDETGSERSWK